MRKSRFTEAQIIGMIKEQEAGLPTVEVCRKHGLSTATSHSLPFQGVSCPSSRLSAQSRRDRA
jgi:putative transposase